MATINISHPPHALLMWSDDINIYAAIPSKDGGLPHITKFERSDMGLNKALNMLRQRYDELPSGQKNYTIKSREPSTVNGKPPVQNELQRAAALNVLRKLGLV
jgi:hypothetical protein